MRSVWTGAITFGLITIPVRLYTAVSSDRINFDLLHASTGNHIRYRRVDEQTGREVDWKDIVKGYEVQDGTYVTFTHDELDELSIESMRTIDIDTFVDLGDIDPIYYEKTYYVAPREGGEKAYQLLVRALDEQQRVGIAKFAMRQKEHLCALRVKDGMFVLETMHWPSEIREPDIEGLDARVDVRDRELAMAKDIVDQLTGPFEPGRYRNTFERELKQAAKRKLEGEEVTVASESSSTTPVDDLMAALEESLRAAKAGRRPRRSAVTGSDDGDAAKGGDDRQELREHTKDDLMGMARERDLEGRSSMTKDELVDALAER